jgi:hypothetical protein
MFVLPLLSKKSRDMIRDDIKAAQIAAMKAGEKDRLGGSPPDPQPN